MVSPFKLKHGDSKIASLFGNPVPFPEDSVNKYLLPFDAPEGPVLLGSGFPAPDGVCPVPFVQLMSSSVPFAPCVNTIRLMNFHR